MDQYVNMGFKYLVGILSSKVYLLFHIWIRCLMLFKGIECLCVNEIEHSVHLLWCVVLFSLWFVFWSWFHLQLQVKNLSAMEVNLVRPFVGRALQAFYKHGSPELVPNPERMPPRQPQATDSIQRVSSYVIHTLLFSFLSRIEEGEVAIYRTNYYICAIFFTELSIHFISLFFTS